MHLCNCTSPIIICSLNATVRQKKCISNNVAVVLYAECSYSWYNFKVLHEEKETKKQRMENKTLDSHSFHSTFNEVSATMGGDITYEEW